MRAIAGWVCAFAIAGPGAALAQSAAPAGPPATGLVVGAGNFFSPIIGDMDKAVAFYRDGLGFEVQGGPSDADANPALRNMFGLPGAHIRWTIARPPGMTTGVEIVEIEGAGGRPLERRVQDPGAATLVVYVRDLETTLVRLKALGAPVLTSGGAPARLSLDGRVAARMAMVEDPGGHFVEIVQPARMPATRAPADANVVDVRVRLTVDDVDKAVELYAGGLGLALLTKRMPADDPAIEAALGGGRYRAALMAVPNSGLKVEVVDFAGVERRRVRGRLQDPGSTRMQLRVRDIDAAMATLVRAGGEVVSTGGPPLALPVPGGAPLKVAIVRGPDNLFVVLIEAPPRG